MHPRHVIERFPRPSYEPSPNVSRLHLLSDQIDPEAPDVPAYEIVNCRFERRDEPVDQDLDLLHRAEERAIHEEVYRRDTVLLWVGLAAVLSMATMLGLLAWGVVALIGTLG